MAYLGRNAGMDLPQVSKGGLGGGACAYSCCYERTPYAYWHDGVSLRMDGGPRPAPVRASCQGVLGRAASGQRERSWTVRGSSGAVRMA